MSTISTLTHWSGWIFFSVMVEEDWSIRVLATLFPGFALDEMLTGTCQWYEPNEQNPTKHDKVRLRRTRKCGIKQGSNCHVKKITKLTYRALPRRQRKGLMLESWKSPFLHHETTEYCYSPHPGRGESPTQGYLQRHFTRTYFDAWVKNLASVNKAITGLVHEPATQKPQHRYAATPPRRKLTQERRWSENLTRKCNSAFLQSFLVYSKSFGQLSRN